MHCVSHIVASAKKKSPRSAVDAHFDNFVKQEKFRHEQVRDSRHWPGATKHLEGHVAMPDVISATADTGGWVDVWEACRTMRHARLPFRKVKEKKKEIHGPSLHWLGARIFLTLRPNDLPL